MAGLLYLPRIFVYHAENSDEKKISDVFKIMEKKLYIYIMTPAMILSWIIWLAFNLFNTGFQQLGQTWMILKIIFVIFLNFVSFLSRENLKSV